MTTTKTTKPKQIQKNPYETLKNTSSGGVLDSLLGNYDYDDDEMDLVEDYMERKEKQKPKKQREDFSLFRYQEYHEDSIVKKEISQLTDQLKGELKELKKASSDLITETKEAEKVALTPLPEKPGIYHVRFLEILIKLVQTIRLKIGESKTWLEAMVSKKKKRGSLFMTLSKKKGTQYSLSQELQSSRSVQ